MSTLTPREQFNRDGFYIARNLIDLEDVIPVREGLRRCFTNQLIHLGETVQDGDIFSAMLSLHKKDIGRYRKLVGALWRKAELFDLMHHSNIMTFLKKQFGWEDIFVPGGQVVHIMSGELKIPDGYFGLIPHQDYPSVQGSLDGVVVWVPLVKVDRDSYPLEVLPGSHLFGLLPSKQNGDSTWEVIDERCLDEAYMPIEVDIGDVVFMSMFTVHRSSQQGSAGRLRLAVSTRFDNASEETFIERCYPTAYIRTVHREQYSKGFPTIEQVAKVFKVN